MNDDFINSEIDRIFGSKQNPYVPGVNSIEKESPPEIVDIDKEISKKTDIIFQDGEKVEISLGKNNDGINTIAWLLVVLTATKKIDTKLEKNDESNIISIVYNKNEQGPIVEPGAFPEAIDTILKHYKSDEDYKVQLSSYPALLNAFTFFEKAISHTGNISIAYKYRDGSQVFAIETNQSDIGEVLKTCNIPINENNNTYRAIIGKGMDNGTLIRTLGELNDKIPDLGIQKKMDISSLDDTGNTSSLLLALISICQIVALVVTTYLLFK